MTAHGGLSRDRMRIAVDKNQTIGSHGKSNARKHNALRKMGVTLEVLPVPVGDYVLIDDGVQAVLDRKKARGIPVKKMDLLAPIKRTVDTKKSLVEIAGNVCNAKGHARFRDELLLAQENGIEFYLLIENTEGVRTLNDLFAKGKIPVRECAWKMDKHGQERWLPIHTTKVACMTLAKALYTISKKYDVHIVFCKPSEAADYIKLILRNGN